MRRLVLFVALAILVFGVLPVMAHAAPVYVAASGDDLLGDGSRGNPYATVMQAVTVAVPGDDVYVGEGTFVGDIVMKDGVSLYGTGAELTTLQGTGTNSVITVVGISGAESISGFTITGGWAYMGGGIYIYQSSPLIFANTITGNIATHGGGIYCNDSAPSITDNVLNGNTADGSGGAIAAWGSAIYIDGNTISGNGAPYGAAIVDQASNTVIIRNTMTGNVAGAAGGCIYTSSGTANIRDNILVGNGARWGGAIVADYCSATLRNNVIAQNSASDTGGALRIVGDSGSVELVENTVYGNSAPVGGGIERTQYASAPTIANCIIWGNGDDLYDCSATYSCIEDGDAGEGNISAAPSFASTGTADYRLRPESLCIDTANPAVTTGYDIAGTLRPQGAGYDMGAWEYVLVGGSISGTVTSDGTTRIGGITVRLYDGAGAYVGIEVTTAFDGTYLIEDLSPGTYHVQFSDSTLTYNGEIYDNVLAFADAQDIVIAEYVTATADAVLTEHVSPMFVSSEGDDTLGDGSEGNPFRTVTHAMGVAYPGDDIFVGPGTFSGDITMKDEVSLYGAGAELTTLQGTGVASVITAIDLGAGETISGFTITGGWAASGGGIYLSYSSPTITENTITGNETATHGGGIYGRYSSPIIVGNTITGNTAAQWGGGIGVYYASTPTISGNNIAGNSADISGAIDEYFGSVPTVTGNIISGNTASNSGGAMYVEGAVTITDNVFSNNVALGNAAAIYCETSIATISHNTIYGNSAGVYNSSGIQTISNSILWNAGFETVNCAIQYSCVEGGDAGTGNVSGSPSFAATDTADFRLKSDSSCINLAHPSFATATDINGVARPTGDGFDMGAYEYVPLGVITGTVTNGTDGIEGVTVRLFGADANPKGIEVNTLADGTYAIGSLEPAIYYLEFNDLVGRYLTEYYEDSTDLGTATQIIVPDLVPSVVDAELTPGIPDAVDDSYETPRNIRLDVDVTEGLLANDVDPADRVLAIEVSNEPSHGILEPNGNGAFGYTPNPGFAGTDTFTYIALNGLWSSEPATVTIAVTNSAPVALDDSYSILRDTQLVVPAVGVLGNDDDADNDPLSATLLSDPLNGTVELAAEGGFTYTPDVGFYGTDSFAYRAYDDADHSSPATVTIAVTLPPVIPISGGTRFQTAVATSEEAYPAGLDPAGARTVVIATARNWPDALGGSSLAGVLDGPILLVDTTSVPDDVTAEITRLEATDAIILGGTGAVAESVADALKLQLGEGNVERIAGGSRYATADQIAERVITLQGPGYDGTAFVATGGKFPDALGAAPLAAANGWPLYLVNPLTGISDETYLAMDGVTDVLVLGGTSAVSSDVYDELVDGYGVDFVERLTGDDRYDTAVTVATYGVEFGGLGWNRVALATGANFPDALAGGVLQGKVGGVMLLTRPEALNSYAEAALSANKADISTVTFFGGLGALPQVVRDQVSAALIP